MSNSNPRDQPKRARGRPANPPPPPPPCTRAAAGSAPLARLQRTTFHDENDEARAQAVAARLPHEWQAAVGYAAWHHYYQRSVFKVRGLP